MFRRLLYNDQSETQRSEPMWIGGGSRTVVVGVGAVSDQPRTLQQTTSFSREAVIGLTHVSRSPEECKGSQQQRGQSDLVSPFPMPFLLSALLTLAQEAGDLSASCSSSFGFQQ